MSGVIIAVMLLVTTGTYLFSLGYYAQMTAIMTIVTYLIYSQLGFDRMMNLKHEHYISPLVASIAFALMTTLLFAAAMLAHISFAVVIAALFAYTVIKAIWLVFEIGRPDFRVGGPLAFRALRKYLVASLLGLAGSTGFNQIPLIILGAVAPPLQSAALVAMRGLTQPLQIVVRSLDIIDKNLFHHKADMTPKETQAVFLRQTSVYVGLALGVLLVMAVFGRWIIHMAYGARYEGFTDVLILTAIASGLLAISYPIETGVVKVKRLNRFNAYRVGAGIAGALLALVLCKPYGAVGSITATLVGWTISLLAALWLARDLLLGRPVNRRLMEKT